MKALILNGSPRPQGVVVQALRTAADTLRQAGADIEWIDAYRMEFRPCTGCMQCRTTNICPLPRDAAHAVGEQIRQADLLVVGTPTSGSYTHLHHSRLVHPQDRQCVYYS